MKIALNDTKNTKKPLKNMVDFKFLIPLLIILTLGTIMIFSASYPYASSHYGDGAYYIKRHLIFLALGIAMMVGISFIPVSFFKKMAIPFFVICVVLLILVLFMGFSEGVAKRWLGIPGTPLSFQPSELMKLGIVLILSYYFSKNRERKETTFNQIIAPGLLLVVACGLVLLEKHLSGTIIIALIGLSVIFVSGASLKKMFIYYGLTAGAGGAVFLLTNSYAMKRIESFLNPQADILSDKWQTTQGLFAIGSGGLFGLGLGESRQKYSYVSEPQNDFIFTIWCEETGFIGAILLLLLYILLIYAGYRIAFKAKDTFSSLVTLGITSQIAIQSLLNIAVVTDLIPNTGISLPFFSYGGSSIVILLIEMGIILSVSKEIRKN